MALEVHWQEMRCLLDQHGDLIRSGTHRTLLKIALPRFEQLHTLKFTRLYGLTRSPFNHMTDFYPNLSGTWIRTDVHNEKATKALKQPLHWNGFADLARVAVAKSLKFRQVELDGVAQDLSLVPRKHRESIAKLLSCAEGLAMYPSSDRPDGAPGSRSLSRHQEEGELRHWSGLLFGAPSRVQRLELGIDDFELVRCRPESRDCRLLSNLIDRKPPANLRHLKLRNMQLKVESLSGLIEHSSQTPQSLDLGNLRLVTAEGKWVPLWKALISARDCELTQANFWIPVPLFEQVVEMPEMEPYLTGFSRPDAWSDHLIDIGAIILGKPCRLESRKTQRSDRRRRSRFTHYQAKIERPKGPELDGLSSALQDALNIQEAGEEHAGDAQTDDMASSPLHRVE